MIDSDVERFHKAFRLIGEFMFHWASLESKLNQTVSTILNMSALEGAILTANITLRDKIALVRTFLNLYGTAGEVEVKALDKILIEISDLSNDRNIVAHNMFAPEREGVKFYITKAKGKLSLPKTIWSDSDFDKKLDRMNRLETGLDAVIAAIQGNKHRGLKPGSTRNALLSPADGPAPLGLLGFLALHAQESQDSPQSVVKKPKSTKTPK